MMYEDNLIQALKDYRFLLNRGYSQKAGLKLVGDHYLLKRTERSILYRGVSDENSAERRKCRVTGRPENKRVFIDGYNILFTLGNYLNGRPVFIADDGLLRDAGELRGRFHRKKLLDRITEILFEFMVNITNKEYIIYLDQPVSNSGNLSARINAFFEEKQINGKASTVSSPDQIIIQEATVNDVVCSSDSVIIDQTASGVFDLSRHLMEQNFNPVIENISDYL